MVYSADLPAQPLPITGQETGVDLGLESFATLADGTMIHNPRCYRKAERRLKTAQRRLARHKKGSNRRRKAVNLLARARQTVGKYLTSWLHITKATIEASTYSPTKGTSAYTSSRRLGAPV